MFHMDIGNRITRSYCESACGLYYSDIRKQGSGMIFVNTVDHNKNKHSRQTYLQSLNARILKNRVGGPSYDHFQLIV